MAKAILKAIREAYRKDKKRNPYGLYVETYGEWLVKMPKNAAESIVGNEEIRKAARAEVLQYTDAGYLVKFIVNGDGFTEILNLLKREKVEAKYCLNDPCDTWKAIVL